MQREPGAISSAAGFTNSPEQGENLSETHYLQFLPFSSVTPFSICSAESLTQQSLPWPGAVLTDAFASVGELGGNFHEPPLIYAHADQSFVHPSNKLTFSHKHVECGSPVIAKGRKAGKNVSGSLTDHSTIFFESLTVPRLPLALLA